MRWFDRTGFQGASRRKGYFEGWYFKHVSAGCDSIYSFIPGISLDAGDPHAFIQAINGITGKTAYVRYPLSAFSCKSGALEITLGNSVFTRDRLHLDIASEEITVQGDLAYSGLTGYLSSLRNPGIMGWFSYIPFMECNHEVVSADHAVNGSITVNGSLCDFSGGRGYIEKDWGRSFPESWIWLQCNDFMDQHSSLFLSIAKIPWLGRYFVGLISFVLVDGRFHTFATWNGARIEKLSFSGRTLEVSIAGRKERLEISAVQGESGQLKAPVTGVMSRRIKESVNSSVTYRVLRRDGTEIAHGSGKAAGLEIIERIFSYFT